MNFSQRQRDPRRGAVGFGLVVLFHAAIVYALLTGLAKKVVDVVRAPIETKVIEEVKKPPPPPEIAVPPPPRLEAPPPPFIPPPEVQVAAPPPPQPTITAVTPTPPPAPVTIAPAPPPVVATPAPPPPPAGPVNASVACQKQVRPEVPALNDPVTGSLRVLATIRGNKVATIAIESNTLRSAADRRIIRTLIANVEAALREYECAVPDGTQFVQEFNFKIN